MKSVTKIIFANLVLVLAVAALPKIGQADIRHTVMVVDGTTDRNYYLPGETVTIRANLPPVGLIFGTWTGPSSVQFRVATSSTSRFIMPEEDVTVTATFREPRLTIQAPGTTGQYEPHRAGDLVTITTVETIPYQGNTLYFYRWLYVPIYNPATGGWTPTNVSSRTVTFVMPPYDTTVLATFARPNQVTVVNGTTSQNYYFAGDTVTIRANTPPEGLIFGTWTGPTSVQFRSATSSTSRFTMPAEDVIVTATFREPRLTIQAPGTTGGYESHRVGETVTVTTVESIPYQGTTLNFYRWLYIPIYNPATGAWTPTNVSSRTVTFTMPPYDTTILATFARPNQLTVINGSGSGLYVPNTYVPIVADPPIAGQVFDRWISSLPSPIFGDVNSSSTTFLMPNSSVTVTAIYKVFVPEEEISGETGLGEFPTIIYPSRGETISIPVNNPDNASLSLAIYDVHGYKVRTLDTSTNPSVWNGRDDDGEILATDIYMLLLKIGDKAYKYKLAVIN